MRANAKVREGTNHPDRNAQFEYINTQAEAFLAANEPVISVDTKKKELVGDYENAGRVSGLDVTVAHFPPGTSKWNKIEHRLFSHLKNSPRPDRR